LGPRSFQLLTCKNQTDSERDSRIDGVRAKRTWRGRGTMRVILRARE
jgi:hypothetical protein